MNLDALDAAVPAFVLPRGAVAQPTIDAIVRTEGPFVLRIVRRLGVAPRDVEDVAQEVFLITHRRLGELRPEIALRSFLFGIARRVVANYRRLARHANESVGADVSRHSTAAHQERDLARARARTALDAALDALDADKREVFALFELEGMPMSEVADVVGCPQKTAFSRLYAARESIRKRVEAELGRELTDDA